MADTLKFGPQWLRDLSDGSNVPSLPPALSVGMKGQLAKHRYGREEVLTLFPENAPIPDIIKKTPSLCVEECQKPLAFMPLTDEEQRLQQSVNSTTALRSLNSSSGRGIGSGVRGRGMDRNRGRGRGGRSEVYVVQGPENGDTGGFTRPRRGTKDDWQEVPGHKRFDRSFSRPYEEGALGSTRRIEFSRSLSNENWRERDREREEEEDDWRKAGTRDRWSTRGSWRASHSDRGGVDLESRSNGPHRPRTIELTHSRSYQRSRSSESENVPEWSLPADDDVDAVGTFDSSGQFVSKYENGREKERAANTELDRGKTEGPAGRQNKSPDPNAKRLQSQEKPPSRTATPQSSDERPSSAHSGSDGQKEMPAPPPSQPAPEQQLPRGGGGRDGAAMSPNPQAPSQGEMPPPQQPPTLPPPQNPGTRPDVGQMAAMMMAQMNLEQRQEKPPEAAAEPKAADGSENHWFYKDPQGEVQGPFTSEEMASWFSAGFFNMTLEARRACDEVFQPLGELIKTWGRVPFQRGPAHPPLLNPVAAVTPSMDGSLAPPAMPPPLPSLPVELNPTLHQQFLLQYQALQHQQWLRHIQLLQQVQEQEATKGLSPQQQQQLAMQMLLQQSQPMLSQQQQQQLAAMQQLHPQGPPPPSPQPQPQPQRLSPQPAVSQPSPSQELPPDAAAPPSSWAGPLPHPGLWPRPTGVWELEQQQHQQQQQQQQQQHQQQMNLPGVPSPSALLEAQREKLRKEEQEQQQRKLEEEQKRLQQEELFRKQEELRRQEEEIRRQREEMQREKEELERQRQLKEKEEALRREEEERKRLEMERLRQEEQQRRKEEEERERQRREEERRLAEERRRIEEEKRRAEEERKAQEEERRRKLEEEHRRQQEAAQRQQQEQELMFRRQQEEQLQRQQAEEERRRQQEMQKKLEAQRAQEIQRQQQEALRKLQSQQQEQLANIQLPASAQWGHGAQFNAQTTKSMSEILEEEERQHMEREAQRQAEQRMLQQQMQQQQMMQQQNQRTWANASLPGRQGTKSLVEIQAEQSKQVAAQKSRQAPQPRTASTVVAAAAAASASSWASAWKNSAPPSSGFWDEPPPTPVPTSQPHKKAAANKDSSDFPALGNKKSPQKSNANKSKSSTAKIQKEEEVVQRIFQETRQQDEFTTWCEAQLRGLMHGQLDLDVPTFVGFLQVVESPYEVTDYIKTYLGESKEVRDFAKQYLEKRSEYKNKQKKEKRQEEDSIWGPAPAITPKEVRGSNQPEAEGGKSKSKKKKTKMSKVDPNFLGFSVQADPDRINVGAIEPVE